MPTLESRITTDRPGRYITQICKHAAAMGSARGRHMHRGEPNRPDVQVHAEWSDTKGVISFVPWGTCTMTAEPDLLVVHIDATDTEALGRIRDIIANNLDRFSRRDPLAVHWVSSGDLDTGADTSTSEQPTPQHPRFNYRTIMIGLVGALAVTIHVVLGGSLIADVRWAGTAAVIALALIALKVGLLFLGGRGLRRRLAHSTAD